MVKEQDDLAVRQLFLVGEEGEIRPLTVPPSAQNFTDILSGYPLGVYSALRTFNHNQFLYLEAHLERLRESMRILGWHYEFNEVLLRQALHQVCTAYPLPDSRVRIDVLARPITAVGVTGRLLLTLIPFSPPPETYYQTGVQAAILRDLHRDEPKAKTAEFAQIRRRYQKGDGAYEYLLLDANGRILEGLTSNFYAVKDGVLLTAGSEILEGITRKIVLKLAGALNIPVQLTPISVGEIPHIEEAMISSSSRAVIPVVQIDEMVVGNGRPGPIYQELLAAYQQFVAQEVKTAVS